jgi:hypothetical protein
MPDQDATATWHPVAYHSLDHAACVEAILDARPMTLARGAAAGRVPEYRIADPAAPTIERWRPDDARPEVIDDILTWRPDTNRPHLTLDVVALFANVIDAEEV